VTPYPAPPVTGQMDAIKAAAASSADRRRPQRTGAGTRISS